MRCASLFAAVFLGLVSPAQAQRFGFTREMLPTGDDGTGPIALGDVDGDGDLDTLVGTQGQCRLRLNDGRGHYTDVTATNLPALFASGSAVALGDVDGDGDLDAFLGNAGTGLPGGQNLLHLNDGTGVFTDVTATSLPALVTSTRAIAPGDVDGDGDLDVYLGNGVQPDRLYLNGGTGIFADATATNLPVLPTGTYSVALEDVDGDADLDAFMAFPDGSPPFQPGRLYRNGGTGVLTDVTATNLPNLSAGTVTYAVALGDVDGDGDLDGYIGTFPLFGFDGHDRLYLNDGTGVFADATGTNLPAPIDATFAVALGDVDGDGDLDAFAGNYQEQSRLYLNDGTGAFADATATNLPAILDWTTQVALGDADGDGDLDAFMGSFPRDRLLLNGGAGVFTDVTAANLPALLDVARAVALGDVDGDGDLDALVGNTGFGSTGGRNRLHLNGGTGVFTEVTATNLPSLLDWTQAVALGDVDGDGDLDAYVGNTASASPGGQDRLHLNDGAGHFTDVTATNLPAVLDPTFAVALGDVDGDGDLDVFVGNGGSSGQHDRLHLNDGAGHFSDVTAANLPYPLDGTRAVALGDVDGDGDLDAYVGKAGGGLAEPLDRLYLNGGTGVLTDATATNLPSVYDWTFAVALGDVDGDGDLDAFAGNLSSFVGLQDRLYLNGGTGVFADATATNLPADIDDTYAVALGDVDGDGDLDALVGNGGYPSNNARQNRLYLNDATGAYADATPSDLPAMLSDTRAVALGDLDGDGDLDAILGHSSGEGPGQSRLYTNLTRQVAWRGVPRIGKPLTLDLRGPSWGAWFLGFSRGTADIEVPPFGTLRLDPGEIFRVFAGLLDGAGKSSITFPVPADPALVGASGYWQAIVVSPARLTNLEVTTLTSL